LRDGNGAARRRSRDARLLVPLRGRRQSAAQLRAGARRLENLRHNPRVALTIIGEDFYTHLSLLGHVVEQHPDTGLADLDRLSMRYLEIPYPERDPAVTTIVQVDTYHTYGSGCPT
jgi:hypothetical protein